MSEQLTIQHESISTSLIHSSLERNFYTNFPLLLAISESTQPLKIEMTRNRVEMRLWVDEDELFFPPIMDDLIPKRVKKVWVSQRRAPLGWRNELYDVNFIYDIETTLSIKNFRKNVKRFEKANPSAAYHYARIEYEEGLQSVIRWYEKSKRKEFADFGYTNWLVENYHLFKNLRARVVTLGDVELAFSLWGALEDRMGVHLICKDVGLPYLQDWTRYRTYDEMRNCGFKMVNDGGDCNVHGIRRYKEKLRPRFIIPLFSWLRN